MNNGNYSIPILRDVFFRYSLQEGKLILCNGTRCSVRAPLSMGYRKGLPNQSYSPVTKCPPQLFLWVHKPDEAVRHKDSKANSEQPTKIASSS